MSLDQHIQAFKDAMASAGVPYSGIIETDGSLRRIHIDGDARGSRNGWYLLYGDERPAGAFGTWKGASHKWAATDGLVPLSDEERAEIAERRRRDKEAAAKAMAE